MVDNTNIDYDKFLPVWKRNNDFVEGADTVKGADTAYLPMLPSQYGQTDKLNRSLYDIYKDRAVVWPGATKTAQAFTGIINRKQPAIEAPDEYKHLFTVDGETIQTAAIDATREMITKGLYGILIDYPDNSKRPYAVQFTAESIINWEYEIIEGVRQLTHVALVTEYREGAGKVEQGQNGFENIRYKTIQSGAVVKDAVKILHLVMIEGQYVAIEYTRVNADNTISATWEELEPVIPLMNGKPLNFIPFTPMSMSGLTISLDYPLITEVVNLNKAHYQNDADYRNALAFAGRPTPCVSGLLPNNESGITLGTTTVLQFEQGGQAWMLGLDDSSGINSLRQAAVDLQHDMAVAGTRALMSDPAGVEAATTVLVRREGEHGVLGMIAKVIGAGFTRSLEIMAEWQGINQEVSYEIQTDFDPTKIDPQTLSLLWNMYTNNDISFDVFWYNLQRGELVPDLRTKEEEMAILETKKAEALERQSLLFEDETDDETDNEEGDE